ncbi:MAG: hypothetical protein RR922_02600 [Clostridia bacterium]
MKYYSRKSEMKIEFTGEFTVDVEEKLKEKVETLEDVLKCNVKLENEGLEFKKTKYFLDTKEKETVCNSIRDIINILNDGEIKWGMNTLDCSFKPIKDEEKFALKYNRILQRI